MLRQWSIMNCWLRLLRRYVYGSHLFRFSLVPRPIPAFQCCTLKAGGSGRRNHMSVIAQSPCTESIEPYMNRTDGTKGPSSPSGSFC